MDKYIHMDLLYTLEVTYLALNFLQYEQIEFKQ